MINLFRNPLGADENKGGYFLPVTDKDYDIVRHYLKMIGDR